MADKRSSVTFEVVNPMRKSQDQSKGTTYSEDWDLTGNGSEFEPQEAMKFLCEASKNGDVKSLEKFWESYSKKFDGQLNDLQHFLSGRKMGTEETFKKDLDYSLPLHTAAEFNQCEVVKWFLEKFADIFLQKNERGETALFKAAEYDAKECVCTLLYHSIKSRKTKSSDTTPKITDLMGGNDHSGDSALHVAVKESNLDCVKAIIDIFQEQGNREKELIGDDMFNKDGDTPVHVAARWDNSKNCEILSTLIDRCGSCRDEHNAFDRRNLDGHTPSHIAAISNNDEALNHLIYFRNAAWKEGLLNTKEHWDAMKVFVILFAVLFCIIILLVLSEIKYGSKMTREGPRYPICRGHEDSGLLEKDEIYWKCHCAPFAYYGNLILKPNVFLVVGVIVFKILQFTFEKLMVPAGHFVYYFLKKKICKGKDCIDYCCCCCCNTSQREEEKKKIKRKERRFSQLSSSTPAEKSTKPSAAAALADPESQQQPETQDSNNDPPSCCSPSCWSFEKIYKRFLDEDLKILQEWRLQKYKSIRHSSKDYLDYEFSTTSQYLFLYFQIAWSISSVITLFHFSTEKHDVWQRARTPSSVPSFFLEYTNFFGLVVNSSCTNTLFSIFKMAFLDQRWDQLIYAWQNFSFCKSTNINKYIQYLWPFFVGFPFWVLCLPMLTHILPGFIMFFWISTPMLIIYYILMRIHFNLENELDDAANDTDAAKVANKNKNESNSTQWKPYRCFVTLLENTDRCILCFVKLLSDCTICITKMVGITWCTICIAKMVGVTWNKRLQVYFFKFFLELWARYMFVLVWQLTFDYASLIFLHHSGEEFSSDMFLSNAGFSGNVTVAQVDNHKNYGDYINAVARVYKWRSQSQCYLYQGVSGFRWVQAFDFV